MMNIVSNEIFKIREKAESELEIKYIGNRKSKIVIAHDVFEYPDDVYNFITSQPVELNKSWDDDFYYEGPLLKHYTPGYTGVISIEARPLRRAMNFIIGQNYKEEQYMKTFIRVNAFKNGTIGPKRACWPHADLNNQYSGTLYLDKKNLGGTAFYRFRNELEYYPQSKKYDKIADDFIEWEKHWSLLGACEFDPIDNDDDWQMIHLETMEWNKLIVYEGNLFHNVFIKPGMYTDCYRTSINVFTDGS